jgi:nucleotide-binding universal stress UspA family protein
MEMPQNIRGSIALGIALDPFHSADNGQEYFSAAETRSLLQAARGLARRLKLPIRLISVWESKLVDMARAFQRLPHINWQQLQLDALAQSMRYKIQEGCEEQLKKMAQSLGSEFEVSCQVINARHPAQGLLAEARASEASLLLLGAGTKAENFFTQGFSTTLTAMAETNIPVIVVGSQCQADFARSDLRVLLADDLRDVSAQAMQNASEWIRRLQVSDLLHLHVEELSLDRVKQVLGTATTELRSTVEWESLYSDLMLALDHALQERLQSRTSGVKALLASQGGTLKTEVRRCAQVRDEIERAAEEFAADLLIFGRHQKVHQQPSMLGRVTYQAMISQTRAIMVVP